MHGSSGRVRRVALTMALVLPAAAHSASTVLPPRIAQTAQQDADEGIYRAIVLAGRGSLQTPLASLLPDFTIPSRGGMPITLGWLTEQFSGLPRLPDNLQPSDQVPFLR